MTDQEAREMALVNKALIEVALKVVSSIETNMEGQYTGPSFAEQLKVITVLEKWIDTLGYKLDIR